MGRRRTAREAALRAVFSQHFVSHDPLTAIEGSTSILARPIEETDTDLPEDRNTKALPTVTITPQAEPAAPTEPVSPFTRTLVLQQWEHRERIDDAIRKALTRWTLERLTPTDAAILRLGVAELLFLNEDSARIIINEYVELAKKYSDDEAPKFINAVLDKVRANEGIEAGGGKPPRRKPKAK